MARTLFGLCLVIALSTQCFGQEGKEEVRAATIKRVSLKGLKSAVVTVAIDKGESKTSLTSRQVQTDIELELQKVGLQIISPSLEENVPLPDAQIHFHIQLLPAREFGHFFVVSTSVNQGIILTRDANIRSLGTTWSQLTLGEGVVVERMVRETAVDHAKSVANDWLKANPK